MDLPSKSRVGRAGARLRAHRSGAQHLTPDQLSAELEIVETFRAAHTAPLTAVANEVRALIDDGLEHDVVGQRLKRMATILDKLDRQPTMSLSGMNDLAGCRAVLPNQAQADG
jgi:putative GTP pyrophosphokinase